MKVEELKNYKTGLYTSLSRDLDAFEKNFILISSGILAFSVTFIKDIVKIEQAAFLAMLFIGWSLILLSVGLMMFAFLSSVNGSNTLWKIVDDFIIANNLYDKNADLTVSQSQNIKQQTNSKLYAIKKRLRWLRQGAIWCFLSGVLSFGLFVGINIAKENEAKPNNKTKREITIKAKEVTISSKDSIVVIAPNVENKTKGIENKK
jgi:hypothetical protein